MYQKAATPGIPELSRMHASCDPRVALMHGDDGEGCDRLVKTRPGLWASCSARSVCAAR